MIPSRPRLLLINPWITDFAAFDFWSKPLGLLYVASVVQQAGAEVDYIDCLDRFHPLLAPYRQTLRKHTRKYGTGKYLRQVIPKPAVFRHIPRYYARYGMPVPVFEALLKQVPRPDAVLVTSGMTYWYPGVQTAVHLVRQHFGSVPVILGGIYATLLPDHARKTSGADVVIEGEAESIIVSVLENAIGHSALMPVSYSSLDEIPPPAWHLYHTLPYAVVMTSRGCPLRCSFCASYNVSGAFRMRNPEGVVQEIAEIHSRFQVVDFAFYDDALLTNYRRHLIPILEKIRKAGLNLRFHTPNGLQCKFLTLELAREMKATGFKTMRLSLESVDETRQKQDMSKKVTQESFVRAAENLHRAGFEVEDLDAYVLMALPGQPLVEVLQSMAFVHVHKIGIRLAAYSPIPGTIDYHRAVRSRMISPEDDPLLTNNSTIPIRPPGLSFDTYNKVALLAKELNQYLRSSRRPLDDYSGLVNRLSGQFSREELYSVHPDEVLNET